MFSKLTVLYFFASLVAVIAAPELEQRQSMLDNLFPSLILTLTQSQVGSVFSSLTSAAASVATSVGSVVTSAGSCRSQNLSLIYNNIFQVVPSLPKLRLLLVALEVGYSRP
jgi:hypothetical protein